MTEIDLISKMLGKKTQDSVHKTYCYLTFGNTFFIKRFPNMINAIEITVQYTAYSWASFNSLVLLMQCYPTHTYLSKHSVYTLQSFVNKYHN